MQKKNGPYIILTPKSTTSYVIANPDNPNETLGTYHKSALKVYKQNEGATPVHPLENMEDHERLILMFPHEDGLEEVGTRGGVCDNDILLHPPAGGWRYKDFSFSREARVKK
ncbi:hypothetical protein AVEN_239348-1 [Araneus ventricosus]|uniref:Uncharacterized protein n=1 Tax=Araneus ventricosus TaxID=182803 RepID=A0A4Y2EC48_ARAVE|nr:hypothetical protein AVEN_239348-1 [Araneus ventricosus]